MRIALALFICIPAFCEWSFFEPNQGQSAGAVEFIARSKKGNAYLSRASAAFHVGGSIVRVRLVSARPLSEPEGLEPTGAYSSYFLGNDRKQWRTGVPHYTKVRYRDVYPGIDLVYYFHEGQLEYDLVVSPGADPRKIEVAFDGASRMRIDPKNGSLRLTTASGELALRKPRVFQGRTEIACSYHARSEASVRFALARYRRDRPLVIDPVIEFSTYLGGNAFDSAGDIKVDAQGNVFLAGSSRAAVGPILDPFQQTAGFSQDGFVIKFAPGGSRILYYAFVGGDFDDVVYALDIDQSGNAYIAGETQSLNFPVKQPLQPSMGGGFNDGFISKLSADGKNLVYSTYLGGSLGDYIEDIVVDSAGNLVAGSMTFSFDFPTTAGAYQTRHSAGADGFVSKLSASGTTLMWSTYLGGTGLDIVRGLALDGAGNVVAGGSTSSRDFPVANGYRTEPKASFEVFVAKLSSGGGNLLWSTYLGGGVLHDLVVDRLGSVYASGTTQGQGFEAKSAAQSTYGGGQADLFALKLSGDGKQVLYSTFIGGEDLDFQNGGLAVDSSGCAYVTGWTASRDFPQRNSLHSFRGAERGFRFDAFISRLSPDGSQFVYSTLFGGNGEERGGAIAVDGAGAVYMAGFTASTDLPLKNPLQSEYRGGTSDLMILKLAPEPLPPQRSPLTASTSVVSFTSIIGGSRPSPQPIMLTAQAPTDFRVEAEPAWLSAAPAAARTPITLAVSVDPAGLNPGVHAGTLTLATNDGGRFPIQVSVRVMSPAPQIVSLSPANIPIGSDETEVTLVGSGFRSGAVVRINGTSAQTKFVNNTTLQFTLFRSFLAQPGAYPITAANPDSAESSALVLEIGAGAPRIATGGLVSAASFHGAAISPGEIITIFGDNLGPAELAGGKLDTAGRLATMLAGTRVLFDGTPAPIVYASKSQTSVVAPYVLQGQSLARVQVEWEGKFSAVEQVAVTAASPAIFTANASGSGQAAALNQDGTLNSPMNAAPKDSVIVLYGTGFGQLNPNASDGQLSIPPFGVPILPVSVLIGGVEAKVLYVGAAPGLVAGAIQINAVIPQQTAGGPLTAVSVVVGGVRSRSDVTSAVAP